jgi:hypothetical protein
MMAGRHSLTVQIDPTLSPASSATFAERFAGTSPSSPDQANQRQQADRLPGLVSG